MRVFLFGVDSDLGFAIAKRLMAEGHKVAGHTLYPASSWKKSGLAPILVYHGRPCAARTDKSGCRDRLQRSLLCSSAREFRRSTYVRASSEKHFRVQIRRLIVTSSATILGDTGPVPPSEHHHHWR